MCREKDMYFPMVYTTAVLFTMVLGTWTKEIYEGKHDKVRDLETLASGYIFRTDGQKPPLFIRLAEGNNEKYNAILENFKKQNGFRGKPPAASPRTDANNAMTRTGANNAAMTPAAQPVSPHGIPVVGQENSYRYGGSGREGYRQESQYGDSTEGFDGGEWVDDDTDEFESRQQQQQGEHDRLEEQQQQSAQDEGPDEDLFKFDDDFGIDFAGPSPFKYHRDVSAEHPSPFNFHRGGSSSVLAPFTFQRDVSAAADKDGDDGGSKSVSDGIDDENYQAAPYTHKEYKKPPGKHYKAGSSFHKAGQYQSKGTMGDSGHKSHQEFDKGHVGKYGGNDLKGHYNKAKGHSSGYKTGGDHHAKHKTGAHGAKGIKFGETEDHKKGHKTTGFHNVYHKDEYNKEQNFYDDAHKQGKVDKYGGKHKDFKQKGGGEKHLGHHDAGYDEDHKGAGGHFGKGHSYGAHKGHSDSHGHKTHHHNKADYQGGGGHKAYGEHGSSGGHHHPKGDHHHHKGDHHHHKGDHHHHKGDHHYHKGDHHKGHYHKGDYDFY